MLKGIKNAFVFWVTGTTYKQREKMRGKEKEERIKRIERKKNKNFIKRFTIGEWIAIIILVLVLIIMFVLPRIYG